MSSHPLLKRARLPAMHPRKRMIVRSARWLVLVLVLEAAALPGCSVSGQVGVDDGGTTGELDGDTLDVGAGDAARACSPALCGGFLRLCGNCLDDDADGFVDSEDPGCLGPCDDTEERYDLDIRDTPSCSLDCYYDNDQGSGNDGCSYDARCDALSPDAPTCVYPPGPGVLCPDAQPALCAETCGPLVPNGCDCFGCCELPAGSGSYVYLGGVAEASGARTCAPETVGDPSVCRPCTPQPACLNDCGRCELCLGRTELPADCFPADGGEPTDGGTSARCEPGVRACGLVTDPACPVGWYCLTGCCIYFG